MNKMIRYTFALFLSIAFCFSALNAEAKEAAKQPADTKASQDGVWHDTKEVGSDVWDGTKEVSSDVWDGTKEVSSDVWDGAKQVGSDIKNVITESK